MKKKKNNNLIVFCVSYSFHYSNCLPSIDDDQKYENKKKKEAKHDERIHTRKLRQKTASTKLQSTQSKALKWQFVFAKVSTLEVEPEKKKEKILEIETMAKHKPK